MPRKRRRIRRSREEIESILAKYEASGLSQLAFAKVVGIHASVLGRWIRNARMARVARTEERSLVRVEVKPEITTGVGVEVLVRGGRVVRVQAGFDEATFTRVVEVLERC